MASNMASYIQGYDEERFATKVDRNFLCLICFNVLRDPVLCPINHHCFCRGCITKHLENYQRCPTCADKLTVEVLVEPIRMVKDYLNELKIHCVYANRGCQEIVQLQNLGSHEATCRFTPAVSTDQGRGVTVDRRDPIHHEGEIGAFAKCNSCGETAKTLVTIEKRIMGMATNMSMETRIAEIEANMERKLEAVNDEVKGLKVALIECFDQMKEVLAKMEDMKEENTRKVRPGASGDKENIIVAGGHGTNTVEMFNWRQKTWSPLRSMPNEIQGATSCVCDNHMTIAGGFSVGYGNVDDIIRMKIAPNPILAKYWSNCPVKLPAELADHSSVLCNDQLMVTGGYNRNLRATSDRIHQVQLVPPYIVSTLSAKMPEPRQLHSTEMCDGNLLIFGGRRTGVCRDNLSSVLLYDINKNKCKQLPPLPYKVSGMATVKWRDNVVVVGGVDKYEKALDTVIMYNITTKESHMLPPMIRKRWGCAAVVIGNSIVVLGGWGERGELKSVEAFNFESYTWEKLPDMSRARFLATAVVF